MKRRNLVLVLMLLSLAVSPAWAKKYDPDARDEPGKLAGAPKAMPRSLEALQEQEKVEPIVGKNRSDKKGDNLSSVVEDEKDMALKIRREAQKEAALSFGARGGLAWRTKQIMDRLDTNKAALDKTYDFRRLLIKAPSNMYIEPPIVSEALNNFVVSNDGGEAAVADTIYEISRQARIVSAPRNWRQYLERDWSDILPPPDILLPETAEERKNWRLWVAEGWEQGYQQAEEIFQADLNRMIADFEGMVRYRVLLAQNKISAPYATMEDRGVSGNEVQTMVGNKELNITTEMRIGDRAIRITQPSTLLADKQGQQFEPPIQSPQ